MMGYYREPEKTAEVIDADGWVHSGDIAEAGPNGQYRIIDRKKELIINPAGKNISPANLESLAKSSPLIGQAVAIGVGQRFISVPGLLDPQGAPGWGKTRGGSAAPLEGVVWESAVLDE